MPRFDLSPDELRRYRPEVAEPADFDAFWARTVADSEQLSQPVTLTRVASPLQLVEVHDMEFSGFAGERVRAWLIAPPATGQRLPAVVEYVGYGAGRGLPQEHLGWPSAGYVHVVMDTRGQGSAWGSGGDTPDPHGAPPSFPGFMTRGLSSPEDYYYRRVFTDAALLIGAVRALPSVDPTRVSVTGGSQGGGIAIAAAGLVGGLVGALPDVPFLCNFERAVGLTGRMPYAEIVRYLAIHRNSVDQTFATLAYFDAVNFAKRATAPSIFSVGLMDPVCPPSTVYAARNHWGRGQQAADMVEYAFNEHEGGAGHHWARQVSWLAARLADHLSRPGVT